MKIVMCFKSKDVNNNNKKKTKINKFAQQQLVLRQKLNLSRKRRES